MLIGVQEQTDDNSHMSSTFLKEGLVWRGEISLIERHESLIGRYDLKRSKTYH